MANEKDKKLQSKEPKMVSLVRHNSINSGRPNFSDIAEFQKSYRRGSSSFPSCSNTDFNIIYYDDNTDSCNVSKYQDHG
ncbi:hypothetical protein ROHU_030385 [Labeo rohita]|uniref:Uncharacterized protein n=1 Tax=Labeo rohita TaxID=84645 RepID=A0A498LZM0_LABRO|nr:hypothetical protein ROHU_030385 [Labeo rohita]